ncbi:MAG: amino acid permease [Gemmatimonadaceae bacterium]
MTEPVRPSAPLRRELGLFSATMLVVSGIIGSGIFFTPAEVARALPDGPWILVVWGVGGLVALAGALTYAELGAMLPDAGGPYVYIREAFGELPAFLYGWMCLATIATAATAAVAMSFGGYIGRAVGADSPAFSLVVGSAAIALLTFTNCLGIRPGAALQNVLTLAKIAALAGLILLGAALWAKLGAPPPVAAPPAPRTSLAAGLAAAFVPVLFTIGGWQQMNMVAGEVRDPQRLIPRALGLGIAIVIACYLGANAVYLRALGRDGLAASPAIAADTAVLLAGPAGARFMTAAVAISVLGFLNVVLLANPRIFFAMARDGIFFRAAAAIHPRTGAPVGSILVMGAWSVALLFISRGDIGWLLGGVVFADWIFFGLGAASVFVLRRRRPDLARPYRVLGYPVVPALFVVAAVIGVGSSFVASPRASLAGVGIVALGVAAFRVFIARRGGPGRAGIP